MRFKIDWDSLIVGSEFTVMALFYFVFEGNFPSKSPWGAYIWRGVFSEFYGTLIEFLFSFFKLNNASVNSSCAQLPRATAGHLHALSVPVGGASANFVLPGGRRFANPGAIPELLMRTRFPIRI